MSGRNRRAKRLIRRIVRMDQTRMRMGRPSVVCRLLGYPDKQDRFIDSCLIPLGRKLQRKGLADRAAQAMWDAGSDLVDDRE